MRLRSSRRGAERQRKSSSAKRKTRVPIGSNIVQTVVKKEEAVAIETKLKYLIDPEFNGIHKGIQRLSGKRNGRDRRRSKRSLKYEPGQYKKQNEGKSNGEIRSNTGSTGRRKGPDTSNKTIRAKAKKVGLIKKGQSSSKIKLNNRRTVEQRRKATRESKSKSKKQTSKSDARNEKGASVKPSKKVGPPKRSRNEIQREGERRAKKPRIKIKGDVAEKHQKSRKSPLDGVETPKGVTKSYNKKLLKISPILKDKATPITTGPPTPRTPRAKKATTKKKKKKKKLKKKKPKKRLSKKDRMQKSIKTVKKLLKTLNAPSTPPVKTIQQRVLSLDVKLNSGRKRKPTTRALEWKAKPRKRVKRERTICDVYFRYFQAIPNQVSGCFTHDCQHS